MKKIIPIILVIVAIAQLRLGTETTLGFSDIDSNYKYNKAIDFLYEQNVIGGYPDGTFKPYKILNRAELLKLVIEAIYSKDDIQSFANIKCFSDSVPGEWYNQYVCFAKELGIVQGYSDNTFKPDQEINFVEALKIAIETYSYKESDVNFAPENDEWYQKYLNIGFEKNLIPDDVDDFGEKFERGKMAEMITRFMKYNSGELDAYLYNDSTEENIAFEAETDSDSDLQPEPESESEPESKDKYYIPETNGCFVIEGSPDSKCLPDQYCLRDKCVNKKDILPQNTKASESYCKYNEVFIDGKCEKAKLNMLFVGSAIEDEQEFNDWIDRGVAGVITATEMKNCPDKIRIHKQVKFCAPLGIAVDKYIEENIGIFDFWITLHPYEIFDETCSINFGKGGQIPVQENTEGTLAHEIMHGGFAGFTDQYCYNPSPDNPNPVDFEKGQCTKPPDEWFTTYFSK